MTPTFNSMIFLLRGFWLIKQPGIRPFVIIPLLINILVFSFLVFLAMHWFSNVTTFIDTHIPHWLHWLTYILWVIFSIAAIIIVAFTFTVVANVIASPFNGLLSEKVEAFLTQESLPSTSWLALIADTPRILAREGHKLLYFLPRAFVLLLLFLIPVVNIAASVLWFLFSAWMMTLQYLDYPMDNHRISFQAMKQQMIKRKFSMLGFGSLVLLLTMIPIVNFFIMPASVAGATALWVEQFKPRKKSSGS